MRIANLPRKVEGSEGKRKSTRNSQVRFRDLPELSAPPPESEAIDQHEGAPPEEDEKSRSSISNFDPSSIHLPSSAGRRHKLPLPFLPTSRQERMKTWALRVQHWIFNVRPRLRAPGRAPLSNFPAAPPHRPENGSSYGVRSNSGLYERPAKELPHMLDRTQSLAVDRGVINGIWLLEKPVSSRRRALVNLRRTISTLGTQVKWFRFLTLK